jgi:V-type H+-transporting ATPase subunit G
LAFAEKVARLKQAKSEAEAEIAEYKQKREAQFQIFSKERMGDSAGHSSTLAKSTEQELAGIQSDVQKNKRTVIGMLLQSVTTVA